MITLKQFYRKTKKGSIIKLVNEVYLRGDVHCGLIGCAECTKENIELMPTNERQLDPAPRKGLNSRFNLYHYIVPDSSAILNQLDVLEDTNFGENIIVLQSVLDEVRRRNLQIYLRLKQLISSKNCYVFTNVFNKHTYTQRKIGESNEEYQDRLVCVAVNWYNKHLNDAIACILLTDYLAIKNTAINAGVFACLVKDYVQDMTNNQNLIDKLSMKGENSETLPEDQFIYPEHLTLAKIHEGITENRLFQGKFQTNQQNFLEATVNIKLNGEDVPVLIQGKQHINRAIHDDIVAVELLPENEWTSKSELVLVAEEVERLATTEKQDEMDVDMKTDKKQKDQGEVNGEATETGRRTPCARVVGIVKRNWRQYCGVLKERDESLMKSMLLTSHLFVPAEKRIPFIRVETRQYQALRSQRIIVAIDSWPRDSNFPKGHYVRALGEIGDKETENELVLLEHDIPYLEFTKAVLNCLPDPDKWFIPEEEYKRRLDLREYNVCSVDPPGCTDIDDALHYKDLDGDLCEIGVHIADVSHFVKPYTAIDLEAASRGTTVYLVDRRINMIPEVLSSNLCSLMGGEERLTFSVIWKMNKRTGEKLEAKFHKSVIKSKGAFTYAEAQLRIDNRNMNDEVTLGLRGLNEMAKILRRKRIENGAIILANMGELKFVEVESETHENVLQLEKKEMQETNSMIEEFMLLANIEVAQKLYKEFPSLALLRRHPKPSLTNFVDLEESLKERGFKMDFSTNKSFSESLDRVQDAKNPFLNLMTRILATRAMTQALYYCTGSLADVDSNFHHFGLAVEMYTHFTSPIRRYADLVVHRLLSHAISYECIEASMMNKDRMQKICDNINYRHRNAQYANRSSVKLNTIWYIKSSKGEFKEDAYVLQVKKNALSLFIPKLALEAIYFLDPPAAWAIEEKAYSISQTHVPTGHAFRQFDKVKVIVAVVDKSTQINRGVERLVVSIVEPPIDNRESTRY